MMIFSKMAGLPTVLIVTSLLATILTVSGCGVMPAGQASTRTSTVTGFTLPVAMAYSSALDVRARVPGIAPSRDGARAFVSRLVTQTVLDVLELQGRSALLPDAVISTILSQLNITIIYEPLSCLKVVGLMENADMMKENCIIVGDTVTQICTKKMMPPPPPGPQPGRCACRI
ncbi:hypothetical protein KIN20_018702 [Parelaphostrongylus tenuis]|uniref:Uncharacterized protein n=1 Tax=Parelaphostrongylus tenuis TaxID=148309 RepID=A0AAD5N408_PARTN|nr:hypothetical protein KIN20_018702 [Parelaphostrongylus tenuis]